MKKEQISKPDPEREHLWAKQSNVEQVPFEQYVVRVSVLWQQ
jgi:hypothetical protein